MPGLCCLLTHGDALSPWLPCALMDAVLPFNAGSDV